jgi:molecular chaperone DnaJ
VFQRKGDHLEVEVPITVAEALRGADVEVPTLHGTKTLRVPPGTKHGTRPAPARRGPAGARRQGQGRHPLPLRDRRAARALRRAARAVDELSKVMNGNPRERLLREAGRALMASRRTASRPRSSDRGVFMISVAAELAEMHPQTLRMYERAA